MATITYFTNKDNLIQMLVDESAKSGSLVLEVQKLPHFLANQIGFSVFEYQISGYPRPIFWTSSSNEVLNQLSSFGANIGVVSTNSIRAKVQNSELFEKLKERANKLKNTTSRTNILASSEEIPDFLKVSSTIEEAIESGLEEDLSLEQTQNFDNWIEKINQTKNILDSLKNNPNTKTQEFPKPKAIKLLIGLAAAISLTSLLVFFTQFR
jgi:hypothetical protein